MRKKAAAVGRRRRRDERASTSAPSPSGRCRRTATSFARTAGDPAVIVDPGDEPDRLLDAAEALGVEIEAILLTHCHFDHIGAVAPVARATGAPVYCPEIERPLLTDMMRWVPPGFGPFESYEPEHTLAGGERLSFAGLDIDVIFTPGHSPGPPHLRVPRRAALRRRPVPGVRRPGGPARRGLGHARALDRGACCGASPARP